MIDGSRTPIEQWPTGKLVGVGLAVVTIAGPGLGLVMRVAWQAWNHGERGFAAGALAVVVFFSVWWIVVFQFGRELLRRWESGRARERKQP